MQDKYSQSQLRIAIANQKIKDRTYYYSLAKKNQQTLSFFQNQRLFILDFDQGKLFYVNQTKNLPFKTNFPQPKKSYAVIQSTKIQYAPTTKIISFFFKSSSEQCEWNFEFQTAELASEWIKLIEYQKTCSQAKEKDIKALNRGIFQMPKIQPQKANDIVKQPQRRIADDEQKLMKQKISQITPKSVHPNQSSKFQLSSQNNKYIDWNHRFYQQRSILTLYLFQKAAVQCFYKTIAGEKFQQDKLRAYQNQSFLIKIAHKFTLNAKKLKNQFRNYHFILDATNRQFVIGVPLTCLIEFQNIVGLVKAKFPEKVPVLTYSNALKEQISQLQRYTRIKNKILQFNTILDLTKYYESPRGQSVLYLDNLQEYLPINLEFQNQLTLIRPEYLLDHVDFLILNGPTDKISKSENRSLRQLSYLTVNKANQFANSFFIDHFPVIKANQLKTIIHDNGLNLKYLPIIYNKCSNSYIKRYIYSLMTAKIIKDYVFESILRIKAKDDRVNLVKLIQQIICVIVEGNNNKSHELWKEISLIFKRKYNIILNHKQILPGYFLNCIMELIPAEYDVSKINKKKKIFQEVKVINPGFVVTLSAKIKSYTRFMPPSLEKLKLQAKEYIKREELSTRILNELFNQKSKKYEYFYDFGENTQWMIEYLSLYNPPQNLVNDNKNDKTIIRQLFDRINEEPPSYFSMNLTNNYLNWCNKKLNTQAFIVVFEKAIQIADYWLQEIHPMRSQLLESLSEYYAILGIHDETIRYMKQSLTICLKFWGNNSSQVGLKHYQLADKYLRAGKKAEAAEYFYKAKQNIQINKIKTNKYGLSLMKLALICLSNLEYDKATQLAKASIKGFQDYQKSVNSAGIYNEAQKIKSYQILARIYEICNLRSDYKELALTCARKFNQTKSKQIFEQMIKICLASCIFKSNNDRCISFLKLVNLQNERHKQHRMTAEQAIDRLMLKNQDFIVMQKFINKFEHFQRSLFQLNSKKRQMQAENKEFIDVLRLIMIVTGAQYIIGLVDEKTSCFAQ